MKRLHITVEGQTEEAFINKTLKQHLSQYEVYVDVRCVLTSRKHNRKFRGGMTTYQKAKNDITRWLIEESGNNDVAFTTMFACNWTSMTTGSFHTFNCTNLKRFYLLSLKSLK